MCGIAGWALATGARTEDTLEAMTRAVAHRGPDDAGMWLHGTFALGHRRLSVIDPTPSGHQPMRRGAWVVAFNGELYGFEALRDELAGLGQVFVTRSDTEVILAGVETWGVDAFLARADGMFALAIVNATTSELWLARDRMGEKPLYFAALPNGVVFASELRGVIAHPDVPREVDSVAVRRFMTYDVIPSPRSVFRAVRKLEPGTVLHYKAGMLASPRRFVSAARPEPDLDAATAPGALWSAISSAVGSRMVSDVPLGFFLSGGLDSTAVVTAAAGLRDPATLDTFTVGFDDPSFDESAPARAVATHLGTRHHETRLTESAALALVPELGAMLDEPLADPSLIPMTLLANFARQHVTVALSGDGGDELFYGYPTFGAHAVARLAEKVPAALREHLIRPLIHALPVSEANWSLDYQLKRFIDGLDYGPFERHFVWIGGTSPRLHATLFEPAFFIAASREPLFADVTAALELSPGSDDVRRLGALYARLYLADGVLQKVDRATMRVALESRAPLLAPAVLDVAARIAPALQLTGMPPRQLTKTVLRRALAGKIPAAILDRPKKGFGVPLTRWLNGPLRPLLDDVLDPTALRTQAIFKAETVERLLSEHRSGFRDHRKSLWALLIFQLWAKTVGLR